MFSARLGSSCRFFSVCTSFSLNCPFLCAALWFSFFAAFMIAWWHELHEYSFGVLLSQTALWHGKTLFFLCQPKWHFLVALVVCYFPVKPSLVHFCAGKTSVINYDSLQAALAKAFHFFLLRSVKTHIHFARLVFVFMQKSILICFLRFSFLLFTFPRKPPTLGSFWRHFKMKTY